MRVVLFDIDGTLLHSGGAGRFSMIQTFEEIFGIKNGFNGISMAGKTDPLILKSAADKNKIKISSAQLEQFKTRYFQLLSVNITKKLPQKGVYTGVEIILHKLHKNTNISMGLLTGNWSQSAEIKLGYFNFNRYFSFGAFGSDSSDRNDLLPIALQRCDVTKNKNIDMKNVVVIGDTPNDINCAKVHGARALAVATGSSSVSVLEQEGADLAVENLQKHDQIIEWILS